jgi:Flp pilus assembly protein TadG
MFAGALVVIVAFFVLALDLSQLYNRKMELQNVADTVALAASYELDGTTQGISNALTKASDRFSASSGAVTYQYGTRSMSWSDLAIEFADSPEGPWRAAEEARASPAGMLFVKVQTDGLNASYGQLRTTFLQFFTNSSVTFTAARAVAGRSAIRVTPLGICAMRDEAARNHNGELEEYGFRRGVGYNLLDLARPGGPAGQTFIVNPQDRPAAITDVATLAPYVCSGTMDMTRLRGGKVTVSPSFPIANLYYHLNSRFGSYTALTAPCDARTAPSDANIMEYTFNGGSPWMRVQPQGQSAALLETEERRWTIAGPDSAPEGTTDVRFGVLWSYAKAVPYAAFEAAGGVEPAGGYSTYDTTAWSTLYDPGRPRTSLTTPYPSSASTPTPYSYTSGSTFFRAPPSGNKSVRHRRVLNLPLLACPVTGSRATVLGIGKFFMTRTATNNSLYGEFAGLVPEQSLGTREVLYP